MPSLLRSDSERPSALERCDRLPWFPVDHIGDDDLEEYATQTFSESVFAATLEEHLLICPECQDRLQKIDEDVAAAKRKASEKAE